MSEADTTKATVMRAHSLDPEVIGPAGLRTVMSILDDEWALSAREGAVLLGVSERSVQRWRQNAEMARLNDALLMRLSYLLGIYKALVTLIPDRRQQGSFLRRPNTHSVCAGRSPLALVREQGIEGLRSLRRWLEGETQW